MTKIFPLFKFPLKTFLIDDDDLFLASMKEYLDIHHYDLKINKYSNPQLALSDLQKSVNIEKYMSNIIENYRDNNFNFEEILKDIFIRLEKIITNNVAVLVVDYSMPSINGLALLSKLEGIETYKILLTGVADEKIAIKAFNEGLINCYLKKDEKDLFLKLNNKIIEGKNLYFSNASKMLSYLISKYEAKSLVLDNGYSEIVKSYINKYQIMKYYLIDSIGSCYMESKDSNYMLYITGEEKNKSTVEFIDDLILEYNQNAPRWEMIKNDLKRKKIMVSDKLVYQSTFKADYLYKCIKTPKVYINDIEKYYYYFSSNNIGINGIELCHHSIIN